MKHEGEVREKRRKPGEGYNDSIPSLKSQGAKQSLV